MNNEEKTLKALITELTANMKAHDRKSRNIKHAIDSLREDCTHQFEWIGNNHNDNIEECIICGIQITV